MTDEIRIAVMARLAQEEAEPGLSEFRAELARLPFDRATAEYREGKLRVNAWLTSDSATDDFVHELNDRINELLFQIYPSLDEDPLEFEDPLLGLLLYDDEFERYEGRVQLGDVDDVEILLNTSPEPPRAELVALARNIVERWSTWDSSIDGLIVADILPTYGSGWQEHDPRSGDAPLSLEQFKARLTISSVTVDDADLSVELAYDNDEMFGDHYELTVLITDDAGAVSWGIR